MSFYALTSSLTTVFFLLHFSQVSGCKDCSRLYFVLVRTGKVFSPELVKREVFGESWYKLKYRQNRIYVFAFWISITRHKKTGVFACQNNRGEQVVKSCFAVKINLKNSLFFTARVAESYDYWRLAFCYTVLTIKILLI